MSTVDPVTKVAPAEAADWPLVLDGELMRAGEAMIPAGDDGLIRGDGAFDAFPVVDGRPFARAAHLDRLERSCRALGPGLPARADRIRHRPAAQAGAGRLHGRARCAHAWRPADLSPWNLPAIRWSLARPVRLLPVTYDPSVLLSGVKSLSDRATLPAFGGRLGGRL